MLPRGKTLPDIQLIIVQDVSDVECKFLFKNFIFNRSVAFIIFRVGHPSPLSHSRIFHHSKQTPYMLVVTPFAPSHWCLVIINLLSVSINLPTLDISYKWSHTICDFLQLTSFT